MRARFAFPILMLTLFAAEGLAHAAAVYDPLALADPKPAPPFDLTAAGSQAGRSIPLRIYLPADSKPAAVILFSHGLGGSREGNVYMGEHWAARGYVVVCVQHPGSDTSVWRDKPAAERMAALRQAASLQNMLLRVRDIPTVLTQLEKWNAAPGHPLAGRLDLKRVGMSGHSFGAVTTQAVSGQRFAARGALFTDARIKAAIAFSPSIPKAGNPQQAFGAVKIPWLLMTGTRDTSPIGDADAASRQAVFPALPPGDKYELVLDGAEHSAFTDRALPGDKGPRNPNHHRVILALSTAFWDATLRQDPAARAWLDGEGPAGVLEKKDRWQKK